MFNLSQKNANTICETDVEKINETFKNEWENTISHLVKSTPPGQIRFTLVNFTKLCHKVMDKVKINNIESFLRQCLANTASSPKLALTFYFSNFPPYVNEAKTMDISLCYGSSPKYEVLLVFYANNPTYNPNCAKDLISYWFDNFVLPDFKKFKATPMPPGIPLLSYSFLKTYSYAPIIFGLNHFGYNLTKEQYEAIFSEMCTKSHYKLHSLHADPSNTITLS